MEISNNDNNKADISINEKSVQGYHVIDAAYPFGAGVKLKSWTWKRPSGHGKEVSRI